MEHNYYLVLKGVNFQQAPYSISLGPYRERSDAQKFSDFLTDTRTGEQLLQKFGVTGLFVVDNG